MLVWSVLALIARSSVVWWLMRKALYVHFPGVCSWDERLWGECWCKEGQCVSRFIPGLSAVGFDPA